MHPFTTDSIERKYTIAGLAILSICLALLLFKIVSFFKVSIIWWMDVPSVMTFFGLLYTAYEKYIWKLRFLQKLKIVQIPDLNGKWEGHIESSFDDRAKKYPITVRIKQSWTRISILLETNQSISHSITASVLVNQPEGISILHEYRNEPKVAATQTMHSHRGTAFLILKETDILEGEYYTGRDRHNIGSIYLRRKDTT